MSDSHWLIAMRRCEPFSNPLVYHAASARTLLITQRSRPRATCAAAVWSPRTAEDDPGAPFFNDTTKYVVSRTLTEATWRNSALLGAYDADRIRALKDSVDGDLYVSGSGTLVRAMVADGLVDELHLFIYPVTRGGGPRVFPENVQGRFDLTACDRYDNGVVHLAYAPAA